MASKPKRFIYWDSSVFVSYLEKDPGRYKIIDAAWHEISSGQEAQIIVSTEAIVEVAFVELEKTSRVNDPNIEASIDAIWKDPSVQLIEFHPDIALLARTLMRDGLTKGLSLKPKDAIHLATAHWIDKNVLPVGEFFTYDKKLEKYEVQIGIPICEPHVTQLRMEL